MDQTSDSSPEQGGFRFPKWLDKARPAVAATLVIVPLYVVLVFAYGASPSTTDVGYAPEQPVPYSHAQHAGQLGMDCRYCHNTVEVAGHAAVPPTQTCMNCHSSIHTASDKLKPVRTSYSEGVPVRWQRVHDLPDYVYFNHSAHVRRGVGCASCHGRVDKMDVVYQVEPLSMGWCLDCHRNPEQHLRPVEEVYNMAYEVENQLEVGRKLRADNNINPPTDCSTCHR